MLLETVVNMGLLRKVTEWCPGQTRSRNTMYQCCFQEWVFLFVVFFSTSSTCICGNISHATCYSWRKDVRCLWVNTCNYMTQSRRVISVMLRLGKHVTGDGATEHTAALCFSNKYGMSRTIWSAIQRLNTQNIGLRLPSSQKKSNQIVFTLHTLLILYPKQTEGIFSGTFQLV